MYIYAYSHAEKYTDVQKNSEAIGSTIPKSPIFMGINNQSICPKNQAAGDRGRRSRSGAWIGRARRSARIPSLRCNGCVASQVVLRFFVLMM